MMLHHTALGNARMDEFINSARRTSEKRRLTSSAEPSSPRSRHRRRWANGSSGRAPKLLRRIRDRIGISEPQPVEPQPEYADAT